MKNNFSKYNLILCELHYTPVHGKTTSSDPNIESHYLVLDRFNGISGESLDNDDTEDEDNEDNTEDEDNEDNTEDEDNEDNTEDEDNEGYDQDVSNIINSMKFYNNEYNSLRINKPHSLIRNYHNIISKVDYIKPQIAECINLPTLETIAIIKTIWIKIIQRKWKYIYKKRHDIYNLRKTPNNLLTRQITGKWPSNCNYLPGLRGMLHNI
jgi:hypothetical protein